jgi:hypothetical protein
MCSKGSSLISFFSKATYLSAVRRYFSVLVISSGLGSSSDLNQYAGEVTRGKPRNHLAVERASSCIRSHLAMQPKRPEFYWTSCAVQLHTPLCAVIMPLVTFTIA